MGVRSATPCNTSNLLDKWYMFILVTTYVKNGFTASM